LNIKSRRRKVGFLEGYKLEDSYMLRPDRAAGRPGIYGGSSPDGVPILVKVWERKADSNDADLQDIWRHELRQLHRLAGFPGAADCIAHLYDAGYDARGFYLIIAPGQRQPLQSLLNEINSDHWLKQPRSTTNRSRIWANLNLLCFGLEALHSQGLLHRNLDSWAVVTTGSVEPDFQLTGFEWSMRIVSVERAKLGNSKNLTLQNTDSFLQDWTAFGLLAATLLGVKHSRLMDTSINPYEIAEHLTVEEARLLRNIVQIIPMTPLNGEAISAKISDVLRSLAADIAGKQAKLHLAVRLGNASTLSERIREASGNEIEIDDVDAQLAFVMEDLTESPLLMAIKVQNSEDIRLVLRGKYLFYRLQEYQHSRKSSLSWEFAYCESTDNAGPAPTNLIGRRIIDSSSFEILTSKTALERFPRLRGKLSSWEDLRNGFLAENSVPSREQSVHRALTLLQLLEVLYATADVFPVELVNSNKDVYPDNEKILRVKTRRDTERDTLSKLLNLKSSSLRLAKMLEGDGATAEGWALADNRSLGERDVSDTEWQFQEIIRSADQADIYVFRGPDAPQFLREPILLPASAGRDVQFRRRLKALKALKHHQELLRMIADPRQRLMESHDVLIEDEAFSLLDIPKQEALKQLTSTLPLYLVQGPPGVGKTRLVRDLVQRRFADEPTSRLLLTAQSNAAIDHLMDELEKVLHVDSNDGPLVVRSSRKDSFESPSRFDISEQSRHLVRRLAASDLVGELPKRLGTSLIELAAWSSVPGNKEPSGVTISGRAAAQAIRAFEGVVARAANVVFATTNSGELERLIDEWGQFDWVIIEEAAKAIGSELISPLLLSHRRLMIGDHKQLPGFASDQLKLLLMSPEKVQEALRFGEEFIGRSLRDTTTDEILDDVEDNEANLPGLCAEALRLLNFFETAIEAEFQRQKNKKVGRPIGNRLTAQHRMHPVIADLVSRCFYGDLHTDPKCALRFATEPRPFYTIDKIRLPENPIVVVDMPYVQSKIHKGKDEQRDGDRHPVWHNPLEVDATIAVLSLIAKAKENEKLPTLAVLSPYMQQRRRLENEILEQKAGALSNLNDFIAPTRNGTFCHTVDSFQGSEADIVIVSFVRNNGHSNIRSALGFLSDIRRMNVLLSRAKWQLVLIVSLEFLREVISAVKDTEDADTINFLAVMIETLQVGEQNGSVARVPFERLMGREK
jgi:hypothetical protein